MDMENFLYAASELGGAFFVTLGLVVCVVPLAFLCGALACWARQSRIRMISKTADFYVLVFRSTPLLVQLFVLYYGLSQFEAIRQSFFWVVLRDPYFCAVLAMGVCAGAYVAEIMRGALASVPKGVKEAGAALGLSKIKTFCLITVPIAARNALPAYGNEIIVTIKSTSLASTVTVMELTGTAKDLMSETYAVIEIFCMVAAIYLIINAIVMGVFKLIDMRYALIRN